MDLQTTCTCRKFTQACCYPLQWLLSFSKKYIHFSTYFCMAARMCAMEFNATFFAQLWMKHGQVMGSTVHILVTEEKLKFICDGKFDSPSDRVKHCYVLLPRQKLQKNPTWSWNYAHGYYRYTRNNGGMNQCGMGQLTENTGVAQISVGDCKIVLFWLIASACCARPCTMMGTCISVFYIFASYFSMALQLQVPCIEIFSPSPPIYPLNMN